MDRKNQSILIDYILDVKYSEMIENQRDFQKLVDSIDEETE